MKIEVGKNMFRRETGTPYNNWHRKCKRFLIFPKTIGKEKRWLEVAEWEEMFQDNPFLYPNDCGYPYDVWIGIKWLN